LAFRNLPSIEGIRAAGWGKIRTLDLDRRRVEKRLMQQAGVDRPDQALPLAGIDLRAAASLEKHPLSGAVVQAATEAGLSLDTVASMSETPGSGLQGIVDGRQVLITGRKQAEAWDVKLPEVQVGLECVVFIDGGIAGLLRFEDTPRPESKLSVEHRRFGHNLDRVMLGSGDRHAEVDSLA
jgi:cation transport ATPase